MKVNKWQETITVYWYFFLFSIHLDKITPATQEAILIAYIQHTEKSNSKQDIVMRIWKSHTTVPGENMFCAGDAYLRVQPSLQ